VLAHMIDLLLIICIPELGLATSRSAGFVH
jgi:hypothetical protein